MRPAFVGQPLEAALFGATALVWIVTEAVQALHRRPNAASNDRNSLLILRVCIAAGVVAAQFAVRVSAAAFPETPAVFGLFLILTWAGIGLRWWSFHTLGRYFTFTVMTSSDQTVITTGPYRFLRHPSYAGLLMALGGIGAMFGNWLSLAALIVLPLLGLAYRIRVEELALSAALGPAYTTYASGRKRIVPFIW